MGDEKENVKESEFLPISDEELAQVLEDQQKWLDSKGKEGKREDLRRRDLSERDLEKVIRQEANFMGANLMEGNLMEAKLLGANLQNVSLHFANFQKANRRIANLQEANLMGANLQEAKLLGANLMGANLIGANLQEAILASANLEGANLEGAYFESTDFTSVKYNLRTRCKDVRVDTCYGPMFKRFAQDQDFIDELLSRNWRWKLLWAIWNIFADCGRTPWRWIFWSLFFAIWFGFNYYWMGPESFRLAGSEPGGQPLPFTYGTMIYYSVVTFTTLGFGDVTPQTPTAAWWVMAEVVVGYIMLGGLISIFATLVARRS